MRPSRGMASLESSSEERTACPKRTEHVDNWRDATRLNPVRAPRETVLWWVRVGEIGERHASANSR